MSTQVTERDLAALAAELGRRLQMLGVMVATAESCTGGWVAKVLTDIAGSSAWLDRGFVTYSNAAKQEMLGVRAETLERAGAVSESVVLQMAEGALTRSAAGLSVAISGIAGPGGGSVEKPVGTVWLAWARRGGEPIARHFRFAGDRARIRAQSVRAALEGLLELLDGHV